MSKSGASKGSRVDRVLRAAVRRGLRRGLADGSRAWLAVGAGALGIRVLKRMAGPGKPIVVTEELRPGETIILHHLPEDR